MSQENNNNNITTQSLTMPQADEINPSIEVFHAEKENRTKMSQGPQPFHLPYDHAAARLVKNSYKKL